jgi:hypothetical protein
MRIFNVSCSKRFYPAFKFNSNRFYSFASENDCQIITLILMREGYKNMKPIKLTLLISALLCSATAMADSGSIVDDWMSMVAQSKEEQPHWITPLATVTPRLEQEIRLDVSKQYMNNDTNYTNYGGGKGLEIIPTENTEIVINLPNYQTREARNPVGTASLFNKNGSPKYPGSGWQDESLLVKYRLLSANEENGNYIVTAFLGASLPTGDEELTTPTSPSKPAQTTYSNHKEVYTATLAAGKGWGDRETGFSVQSTLGLSDITGARTLVTNIPSVQWNTTFQGHLNEYFWPEIEVNASHFDNGPLSGKNQVLVTYGVMLGRFKLNDHSNLIIGAGFQNALSDKTSNAYERGWTTSARITF